MSLLLLLLLTAFNINCVIKIVTVINIIRRIVNELCHIIIAIIILITSIVKITSILYRYFQFSGMKIIMIIFFRNSPYFCSPKNIHKSLFHFSFPLKKRPPTNHLSLAMSDIITSPFLRMEFSNAISDCVSQRTQTYI